MRLIEKTQGIAAVVLLLLAGSFFQISDASGSQTNPASNELARRPPKKTHKPQLLKAVLANDLAAVRSLLAQGADPNVRDAGGSTALVLAARTLGGDPRIARALLDAGADLNAVNQRGSTALHLAPLFGNSATARMLLERGANTNVLDRGRRSPLITAASSSHPEIVTLLLARGARVNQIDKSGDTALLLAIRAGNPSIVRALLEHGASIAVEGNGGIPLVRAAEVGSSEIVAMLLARGADVNGTDEYGNTPLMQAAELARLDVVQTLLDKGAAVNVRNKDGRTPLLAAQRGGDVKVMRALLDRGADVNARDRHGASALLLAAVRDYLPAVQLLLERGADPNILDSRGRTIRQRAAACGNTTVVQELIRCGAQGGGDEDEAVVRRAAVEAALPLLQRSGAVFREQTKNVCFSCHHQSLPVMAFTTARARGFAVDGGDLRAQLQHVIGPLRREADDYRRGIGGPGQVSVAGYALWTLEAGGWKPDQTTASVAEYLLLQERNRGHWRTASIRPPSSGSNFTTTYVALRGLRAFATPAQRHRAASRLASVRQWLLRTPPRDTEDRVFRLRALPYAGVAAAELERAAKELLAAQREDGGWAQRPGAASDAYATGSVLVALHETGMLAASDPAFQRGVRFLLRTQEEDGSWFVRTRAAPLQPFFETGFPHGKSQFISASATGWATMALLLTFPPAVSTTDAVTKPDETPAKEQPSVRARSSPGY